MCQKIQNFQKYFTKIFKNTDKKLKKFDGASNILEDLKL